jgi:hypothetical protein
MDNFKTYIKQVNESLKDAGEDTDDIESLLRCRSLINGHREYLGQLEASYLEAKQIAEAEYKEKRAEIVSDYKVVTKGKIEAERRDLEIKLEFIKLETTYKRIRNFYEILTNRDEILSQRISYLKEEKKLNNFIGR